MMNVNNERKNIFAYMITTNNNYGGANVRTMVYMIFIVKKYISETIHDSNIKKILC